MAGWLTSDFFSIVAAGFLVGIVVGLTGTGGGALMTPALVFLGVGNASAVVTADLTAAAVSRSAGAVTHARQGWPNMTLAKWARFRVVISTNSGQSVNLGTLPNLLGKDRAHG